MARDKIEDTDSFGAEETARRFEAALRGARLVGHKTHTQDRPGKPRTKKAKSPGKRKALKKS